MNPVELNRYVYTANNSSPPSNPFNLNPPNRSRHDAASVRTKTVPRPDGKNNVATNWSSVLQDVNDINAGLATNNGNQFVLPNGRIYETDNRNGSYIWPVSGPGLHQLSRQAFKILGLLNRSGGNINHPQIVRDPAMVQADINAAYTVWKIMNP